MPASSRLHIDSAAARVYVCICRGGVQCVWAQGRMLHVDNHGSLVGSLVVLFIVVGEWLVAKTVNPARLRRS